MKPIVLTDTHCHLSFDEYQADLPQVLDRAWEVGVERILTLGIDMDSNLGAIRVAESDERIFAAVGIHPNSAHSFQVKDLVGLEKLLDHPKVVAIGEIGLDYYRDYVPRDVQQEAFKLQLEMALKHDLPVAVHIRNESETARDCIHDTLRILGETQKLFSGAASSFRGVLHSFSGNYDEAQEALDMGFFLSISGPVTFKNAEKLRKLVSLLPLERILIETDSPYLSPHPYRGKRNEPANVLKVAEKITQVYNLSLDIITEKTTENANRLFKWS